MKYRRVIISAVLVFIISLSIGFSAQNPNIQNPAAQVTIPPSSIGQSLYDISGLGEVDGNRIITGNVRRGVHFRGTVPYQSPTSFSASLGSSTLRSFLRDSAGIEDISNSSSGPSASLYQPHDLPSQMVTTVSQIQQSPSTDANTKLDSGIQNLPIPQDTPNQSGLWELHNIGAAATQTQHNSGTEYSSTSLRLRANQQSPQEKLTPDAQNQFPVEQYLPETHTTTDIKGRLLNDPGVTEDVTTSDDSPMSMSLSQPDADTLISSADTITNIQNNDILMQIQKQLDDLTRSIEARMEAEQDTRRAGDITDSLGRTGQMERESGDIGAVASLTDFSKTQTLQSIQDESTSVARSNQLQQSELSGKTERTIIEHKYTDSFSKIKFDEHYRTAQEHLKAGRYQKAVDSFTLAAIYSPDEPLCFSGQAHTLFAAGQYLSSALLLIRALELAPEYINEQIDLTIITGGAEELSNRIAELEQLLQLSDATGLRFLLAYVYYHTNKLNDAKQLIETVSLEMPKSSAALAVKLTVDAKLKSTNH